MSIQFRLKIPNVVNYTDLLLKNGTCCDGYTAVNGTSYSSYHDCNQQGFYFIHATGSNICQTIGMTASAPVESLGNTPWIYSWGDANIFQAAPWDNNYKYKISTNGVAGPTLQFNRISDSVSMYWTNNVSSIVRVSDFADRDLESNLKNYNTTGPYTSQQTPAGSDWNTQSLSNNGYAMPGCTGFTCEWNQNTLQQFKNQFGTSSSQAIVFTSDGSASSEIDGFNIPRNDTTGLKHHHMELINLQKQHPDRLTIYPRSLEQKLGLAVVGPNWYAALVDGFTGLDSRGKTLQVGSPWLNTVSNHLSMAFGAVLKAYSDVGITFSYVSIDEEYINFANTPGSYWSDYTEELCESGLVDNNTLPTIYIPDRDHPLPGMKGTTGFDGNIPDFPENTNVAPSEWNFYRTRGITWWNISLVAGSWSKHSKFTSYKNPNGNAVRNILNNPKWDTQGLTHLGGLTLGAVFTKNYNDLRNAWIAAYSGSSFASIDGLTGYPTSSTIPTVAETIQFFKGWSGHFLKGTTHTMIKISGTIGPTLFSSWSHLGETKAWLPAMGLFAQLPWPQNSNNRPNIDGVTLSQFLAWTPYNTTTPYFTSHNFRPRWQTIWNDSQDPESIFGTTYMHEPTLFTGNYKNSWGWWLGSVFWPAWDCTMSMIQTHYYYDTFIHKQIQSGAIYSGRTLSFINYSHYSLNAEEAILTNRSNSLEFGIYYMDRLNDNILHNPVYYASGEYAWGNIAGKRHFGRWRVDQFGNVFLSSILFSTNSIYNFNFGPSDGTTMESLNSQWSFRMGYVVGSSYDLEKYKAQGYIQTGKPIMGMAGTTLYPPPSGVSCFMKRWPTQEFMGLSAEGLPGSSFSDIFTGSTNDKLISANKLKQATSYANIVFHLQHLRGIFRTDPYAHKRFVPWTDSVGDIRADYDKELSHHLMLHNPKFLINFSNAFVNAGNIISQQKFLNDFRNITKRGDIIPVGYSGSQCFPSGTGENEKLMNRLSLEECFDKYIMTGAKITSGPLKDNYIWRITPSPINIQWGITLDRGILGITIDNVRYTNNIGDPTVPEERRNIGIYVIKNNNTIPVITTGTGINTGTG